MSNDFVDYLNDTSNSVPESERGGNLREQQAQTLLDMEEKDAARRMLKEWDESHRDIKPFKEQWKANRARSKGFTGVKIIKAQNEAKAYIPRGASPNHAVMNKAARLKRRLRSTIFADPPIPEATPASDDDMDRDAAEFTTRVLQDVTSEGNLDYGLRCADAFDLGSDYGSGLIRFWVNPQGNGWRPKQIMACQQCQTEDTVDDPVYAGAPKVVRYVRDDGTLTDNNREAAMEWLPKLECELLTGKHVRFMPPTARDLWDAEGVMVGMMVPLSVLKTTFPQSVGQMPPEELKKLVSVRRDKSEELLPAHKRSQSDDQRDDAAYVFVLTRYTKQCPAYPKGLYAIACGEDMLLHRGKWFDEQHMQPLDIPLTQFKQYVEEDNPYGQGVMEMLGPGNEIRASILGAMLRYIDRFGRRKIFLPMQSNIQPHQLQSEEATVLHMVPGGKPEYEDVPDFPAIFEKMLAMETQDLDDESGLQQTAQGLAPTSVKSGLHAERIIEQVIVGLSDLIQNTQRAYVRGCRVMVQLIRAYYTVPQRVQWVGEDGAYKAREWTGEDLGSTKDVRIMKGSFTQLSPSAKAAVAQAYAQMGIIPPEDLQHAVQGNVGGLLGLQDNKHRQRVRRQIDEWEKGPPEGWAPPEPQQQIDPMTGQAVLVPVPDPVSSAIFEPLPVDEVMEVALIRHYELARAMSSTSFARWKGPWQQAFMQAYESARMAAGKVTVKEQQMMAQQQAQAQQQQVAQQQQAEKETADADRASKEQESQAKLALQERAAERETLLAFAKEQREMMAMMPQQIAGMMAQNQGGPPNINITLPPKKLTVSGRDEFGQIAELSTEM